jgi:hypothetical protein
MTKYEVFKKTVEKFQPGGTEGAFMLSAITEVDSRSFKVLLGRNLKYMKWWFSPVLWIGLIFFLTVVLGATIAFFMGVSVSTSPIAIFFILIGISCLYRDTIITVTSDGLDIYLLNSLFIFGVTTADDKVSLPFDRISCVKVKTGKVFQRTHFTFEFLHNDKMYRIKTTVANRLKMSEQAENLRRLFETLEEKQLYKKILENFKE